MQAPFEATIAGLARAAGVGVETVRFYQRRGLMEVPTRSGLAGHGAGVRRYGENDLRRLKFIRSAQAAGFTLAEIRDLLALDATDDRLQAAELARSRVESLDRTIAQLQIARDALATLEHACRGGGAGPCPILSAFEAGVPQSAVRADAGAEAEDVGPALSGASWTARPAFNRAT
jgi:MerR family transcriptional regulator, mercuric resistance operon regulatory protein